MTVFIDLSAIYRKLNILILGSYSPENKPVLDNLAIFLRERGFPHANLANELINEPKNVSEGLKNINNLSQIEELMKKSDFNIFILFPEKNDSTIVELTKFVGFSEYDKKREKTLLLLPNDYDASMVIDLIGQKTINCHRYIDNIAEIQQRCLVFIKTNLT